MSEEKAGRSRTRWAPPRLDQGKRDPLTDLVLVVPIFLIYHLGILAISLRNGVDFVSGIFLQLLDQSVAAYVAVTLAIALGLVAVGAVLRRKNRLEAGALKHVLVESGLLALLMLVLVGWATTQLMASMDVALQVGGRQMGPLAKIVMAAGAGFHEELVFRVILFLGAAKLPERIGWGPWPAAGVSLLASSAIFAAVHYIGPLGDSFTAISFVFRFLAGAYLAAVFYFRGFSVAVYTHTIYDILVFFVFGS